MLLCIWGNASNTQQQNMLTSASIYLPLQILLSTILLVIRVAMMIVTKNRVKDSLPSFNLGCNLEERLVIGEYCIPLASFFGLWSKRHMVVSKHCVRFEGIHIGQGQIYCTCNWSKSLNQFFGKLGIKYIELCTLGSITDKHYEIEVSFKVHTVDS